ncbi:ATP-binding protein [Actinopolyspora mortivallis]|uniref:LuxR family transcriptional regulator n=1 Tax=Actinopolyspora mortivallis TaxID=33906 RepID=A0A2T0GWZ3_ACTMO|nr:LuxR family transcriptional regulator [Actinopolyspora mortivallis]PRW63622.1 LuxR family transcriptional regulator [Actinopolyspora mortivallis]
MLYGRTEEMAAVERVLDEARAGRSGCLVLRGEAGIGKSALLEHVVAAAGDMRVLRSNGIEAEGEIPFAGLHLLLGRVLDRVDTLPGVQARALRSALGLAPASGGDRFLVGLAVLTLLADLAEESPLVCFVDDAHWLDQESADALLFAARRLQAEGVVLLFAARDVHAPEFPASGLPELRLSGLPRSAAVELLSESTVELSLQARNWVLNEARGNPLALLEMPAAQRSDTMYVSPYSARALSTPNRIQRMFAERIAALPENSRNLVFVGAAEETGDLAVILEAARELGASVHDLEPAERNLLVQVDGDRLVFRHPLIRTAAYHDVPTNQRITIHRALARTLDSPARCSPTDLDRSAWHWAAATTGPDEDVAAKLERSAEHARARGGYATVATAYERAAALSPRPRDRGLRLEAAAQAAADAGQLDQAVALAEEAAGHTTDAVALARMTLIRASVADEQDQSKTAHTMLVEAASKAAEQDPDTAGRLCFHAAVAAWNADDITAVERTAHKAADLRLPGTERVRALTRVIAEQNRHADERAADGTSALRELVDNMDSGSGLERLRDRTKLGWWHLLLGEFETAHELATTLERECRDRGAIGVLALVLMLLARTQLSIGKHHEALASASEGVRVAEDTGQNRVRVYLSTVLAQLAAVAGDEQRCCSLTEEAFSRGIAPGTTHAAGARSLLDLGLGRYESAVERIAGVVAGRHRQGVLSSIPDFVEASVRLGQPERAREAQDWYQSWATDLGKPWARAIALRCRALVGDDVDAEQRYVRAVELHQQGGSPFDRARTELLYGEWLRRAQRRSEARTPLRSALEVFERLGADPWTERARIELRATGESITPSGGEPDLLGRLTPQELQVVRLAARGLSNREIGNQLFLSPRTVGYHLSNAYPKLEVASRRELGRLDLFR